MKRIALVLLLCLCGLSPARQDVVNQMSETACDNAIRGPAPTYWIAANKNVTSASGLISAWQTRIGALANMVQGTAANKPRLTRPDTLENMFGSSEDFTTVADWATVRATKAATSFVTSATGANTYYGYHAVPAVGGETYVLRADSKKIDYNYAYIALHDGTTQKNAWCDLTTCTVGTVTSGATGTCAASTTAGWCTQTITWAAGASSATGYGIFGITNADNVTSFNPASVGLGTEFTRVQMRSARADAAYLATAGVPQIRGMAGRQAVNFDGSNDGMTSTATLANIVGASAKTIFLVLRHTAFHNGGIIFADSGSKLVFTDVSATGSVAVANDDGGADTSSVVVNNSLPAVIDYTHDGTNQTIRYNLLTSDTDASGATSDTTGTLKLADTTTDFAGSVGELITFDKVLPAGTRDRIAKCLCRKWGASC